jgi:hypothetical protein
LLKHLGLSLLKHSLGNKLGLTWHLVSLVEIKYLRR